MNRNTLAWIAFATLGAGCDGMLVGGVCLDGYVETHGACVLDPTTSDGGSSTGGNASAGGGGEGPEGGRGTGGTESGSGGANCGTLTTCDGGCVDITVDPDHCGGCGSTCASAVCAGSVCLGDPAGHAIAVGTPPGAGLTASQSLEMLTNAVLISPRQPVRVLVLQASDGVPVSISLELGLATAVHNRGRELALDHAPGADPAAVQARLDAGAVDVLLVPAHAMGSQTLTAERATLLAASLTSFCGKGGIVIALDSATRPGSASSLLDASGLLTGLETVETQSEFLHLSEWTDALAIGVISPFASPGRIVGFDVPADSGAVVVLRSDDDTPVVVHRAIIAPAD